MKKLFYLLTLSSVMYTGFVSAQSVAVLDFPAFEERLHRSNDTLYVYNFWATWCKPCIKELPYFTQLDSMYADKRVQVEFVSLDVVKQLDVAVKPMVKRFLPGQKVLLLDAPKYNEWIDKVSPDWSGALPTTLIVNRDNDIYELKQQSFESYKELSDWVDTLLANLTSK